jgi:hypothetical protein
MITQGNWKWDRAWSEDSSDKEFNGSVGKLISEDGDVILWYGMDGYEDIYCPSESNARLIASAPQLLNSLKDMITYFEQVTGCVNPHEDMDAKGEPCCICDMYNKAKLAIALVEGEA